MTSVIEKNFGVLVQLFRELLYDLRKFSNSDVLLELHLEPEFSKLAADESGVVQRVVERLGMHIGTIGKRFKPAAPASLVIATTHAVMSVASLRIARLVKLVLVVPRVSMGRLSLWPATLKSAVISANPLGQA